MTSNHSPCTYTVFSIHSRIGAIVFCSDLNVLNIRTIKAAAAAVAAVARDYKQEQLVGFSAPVGCGVTDSMGSEVVFKLLFALLV